MSLHVTCRYARCCSLEIFGWSKTAHLPDTEGETELWHLDVLQEVLDGLRSDGIDSESEYDRMCGFYVPEGFECYWSD